MALRTDYKDFIAPESGRRFTMQTNQDGTVGFTDVTQYVQEGDYFSAATLNTLAGAIVSAGTESGSNENGSWLKTADGTLTCWKSVTSTSSATIAFGGHYIAGPIQLGDWPQAFVGDVFAQESVYRISGASPYVIGNERPTATSAGNVYIGASSSTESTRVIHIVGFGRWK